MMIPARQAGLGWQWRARVRDPALVPGRFAGAAEARLVAPRPLSRAAVDVDRASGAAPRAGRTSGPASCVAWGPSPESRRTRGRSGIALQGAGSTRGATL